MSTLFATFQATKVKLAYNPGKILPTTDSTYIKYAAFKKKFGEDGSVMVLGIQTHQLFKKDFFNAWFKLHQNIKNIKGIQQVISLANLVELKKDTVNKKFILSPLVSNSIKNQAQLDSVKQTLLNLPFYKDFLFNADKNASIMAITFDDKTLVSANQIKVINQIHKQAEQFAKQEKIIVHYSGLPYIKTVVSGLIAKEFTLFLGLSILISAIILWLFFRSFYAVLFPVLFVLFGVVWSLALMELLGFEITLLTGIIPPLIVIIGIPNSVLIINKYQSEFIKNQHQQNALSITIEKISITTFIANLTTAVGFGVLYFTQSDVLKEFGITAGIGVMFTWMICLFMLPIIFSFLPAPKIKTDTKNEWRILDWLLNKVDAYVHQYRKSIYYAVGFITVLAFIGISKININGLMVDDLPKNDPVYQDLKFFEASFNGVLPMEITIDAKKKNGIISLSNIKKTDRLEQLISSYPEFSRSISLTSVLKYSSQAFYNGNPTFYRIPNDMEKNFILLYAANSGKKNNMMQSFLDKDRQVSRITFQMKDVGSKRVNELLKELKPRVDSIFNPAKYQVEFTGPIVMYVKGSNYLVSNLRDSLLLAILLIATIMWVLFRGFKMIIISILPNLIPLLITAGLMGYFGIPLKPSTILIFSIALGIASDQTIYFLTSYKQELKLGNQSISQIISKTIKETGFSMIYTAIILFFGFGVFAFSTFGGTVALGTLLAITLVLAMLFNLIFLPALLLSFQKNK
ncbi:efflux RND transporter permease subunit [Pedobacter cryophilus]|nr:MMPL family transporter [Pedobacter cryophilus]